MKFVTDLNNIMVTFLKFCLYFCLGHYIAGGTWPFLYARSPVNYTFNRLNMVKKQFISKQTISYNDGPNFLISRILCFCNYLGKMRLYTLQGSPYSKLVRRQQNNISVCSISSLTGAGWVKTSKSNRRFFIKALWSKVNIDPRASYDR